MQDFPAHPRETMGSLWRNRELALSLMKREVLGRYRGSVMGILWSFLNPLFMLTVYTFVFSVVFKARWNSGGESRIEFALVLFAGLIVFNLFAECVSRAPSLIVGNVNYVKKVVFPLEILPWISLGAALFHASVSLFVWLLAYCVAFGLPQLSTLYLPLILLPYCLCIMGICWILSSLGVFLRDVSQFVALLITVMMFLSPVFYSAASIPEIYRKLIYLNPLTPVIELTRDALYWGKTPSLKILFGYFLMSSVVAQLGFTWFQKTRKGFADVL